MTCDKGNSHCQLMSFLPPANEVWGKVIFSEACVKNSVPPWLLLRAVCILLEYILVVFLGFTKNILTETYCVSVDMNCNQRSDKGPTKYGTETAVVLQKP